MFDLTDEDRSLLGAIATLGPLDPSRVHLLSVATEVPEFDVRERLDRLIGAGWCQNHPLQCSDGFLPSGDTATALARRAVFHLERELGDDEIPANPVELARLLVAARSVGARGITAARQLAEACHRIEPMVAAELLDLVADAEPDPLRSTRDRLRAADHYHHAGEHLRSIVTYDACQDLTGVPAPELDSCRAAVASALLHTGNSQRALSLVANHDRGDDWSELLSIVVRFFADPTYTPQQFIAAMEHLDLHSPGHLASLSFAHACRGEVARSRQARDRAFAVADRVSVIERDILAITDCIGDWLGGDLITARDRSLDLQASSSDLIRGVAGHLHAACAMWQGDRQPAVEMLRELGHWPTLDLLFGPLAVRATSATHGPAAGRVLLDRLVEAARAAPDHPLSVRALTVAFDLDEGPQRRALADEIRQLAERVPCPLTVTSSGWVEAIMAGDAAALDEACRSARASGLWLEAMRALISARRERVEGVERTLSWAQFRLWAERQAARANARARFGDRAALTDLTATERSLAELIAAGKSHEDIAAALYLSVGTVRVYASRLYRRLGVHRRDQLARLVGLEDQFGSGA